jgi:hypothetical protein
VTASPIRGWRGPAIGAAALALVLAAGAWGLSQGPLGADVLRPAAERWLASRVTGGRARIDHVSLAWFGPSRSLGVQLEGVSLSDGRGRAVLTARQARAGVAVASLARLELAPGLLAADDFFAAVSVSPEGRYQLGYDAAGPPRRAGDLWLAFDDLTGPARRGRPLSYLSDLELGHGRLALRQVGGPVAWDGSIDRVRLAKTAAGLNARAALRIDQASFELDAAGAPGLKQGKIRLQLTGLVPAKVLPWTGSTQRLSVLDAPLHGRILAQWASDRGVKSADLSVVAGQGHIRLSGAPTPFQSGELQAAYDQDTDQVVIRTARIDAAQARLDAAGRLWLEPEAKGTPARLRLELSAPAGRLSLSPGIPPARIEALVLHASYVPDAGRLGLETLQARVGDASLAISGVLTRPRDHRSWGVALDGRIDGEVDPRVITALWPDELSGDVRDWIDGHVSGGGFGHAVARARLAPGALQPHRPLPDDSLKVSFRYRDAAVRLLDGAPPIERMQGEGTLLGDRFDMTLRSGEVDGVRLQEGDVEIPRLMGKGKRLKVSAHASGEAQAMLAVVDDHTGGAARNHGFDPRRVTGRGDLIFSVSRSIEQGPEDYQARYSGWIREAVVTDAMLGATLKGPALKIDGTLAHVALEGAVQLGPYRGPMTYAADFAPARPMVQKVQFDGSLDGASLGLSGPAGSSLKLAARIEARNEGGHASLSSPGFSGDVDWTQAGRVTAKGTSDASALRGIGVPIGPGVPARVPVKLTLAPAGAGWSGDLEADAYTGTIAFSDGESRRLRYAAQLTPVEAQKLGLAGAEGQALTLDLTMTADAGTAAYGFGPWTGQVGWSQTPGGKTQYHWRASLTPADLHGLGLPAGIEPRGALPIDVTMTNTSGAWNGSAEIAGGAFRFSASPPAKGVRRLNLGGGVDTAVLANLGLTPEGMLSGPANLAGALELGPAGLQGGHMDADLQKAAFVAPFVRWRKPAGRAMRITVDFAKTADGAWEAGAIRGDGPGFGLRGSGGWGRTASLRFSEAKLEGAFDGALELTADQDAARLNVRARYFDARRLLQEGGQSATGPGGSRGPAGPDKPLSLDAQLAQVRVSETGLVRNLKLAGVLGGERRRPLELTVSRDDGSNLIALKLTPDDAGSAISGRVSDVGEAGFAVFGQRLFRGGQGQVNGRLAPGGADLQVEMSRVRLVQAPALARILTIGSLKGMADQLNGAGIEFTKVSAPVSVRGSKLVIGRARATGPAMGITTQGVIDVDSHSVELSGGIAPSYLLNSAMASAPLIGPLLTPRKGDGLFGLTYSAKGPFASPKISVNPFSLAAPGILRRLFENRSAAVKVAADGG